MRLTYCGNVHAAADLDGWLDVTRLHAPPVARAAREAGRPFGVGAWWNHAVAAELARSPAARDRVRELLAAEGLALWTLNVFPYGDFHDAAVKTSVYRPDWADDRRLQYTLDAGRAVSRLAAEGSSVPLSTLPLGYERGRDQGRMAHNLRVAARSFGEFAEETGCAPVLAIEPEPDCLLETAAATADFLEEQVFAGCPDEELLRSHLGVCVDLCHLAVVGEDPVDAYAALQRRGIAVPKVQVSSCLELREPARHLDRLLAFDEARYLHQTSGDRGRIRALDLPEVAARRDEFAACEVLHTHFHLPLFWDEPDAPLGSTRAAVARFLGSVRGPLPLFEVETYTWSVLDRDWRPERDLVAGLIRELDFADAALHGRG